MTKAQVISRILRDEYEDACDHPKTVLVVSSNSFDCEGGSIKTVCDHCRQTVSEGRIYE